MVVVGCLNFWHSSNCRKLPGLWKWQNSTHLCTIFGHILFFFYVRGSVHHSTIHNKSNKMQQCIWTLAASSNHTSHNFLRYILCITRGCKCRFRLLMMGGVLPETRWASYKYGLIKYLIHCCILLDLLWIMFSFLFRQREVHMHTDIFTLICLKMFIILLTLYLSVPFKRRVSNLLMA
jgi:hypothetical protein